jgi:hypothetical protein
VAQRLALLELSAVEGQRSFLVSHRAEPSTVRARLLRSQRLGLLVEQHGQGAFGDAGSGSPRDLLHGLEIDIGSRSRVAKGAAGDDFAPLGSKVTQFVEFLG